MMINLINQIQEQIDNWDNLPTVKFLILLRKEMNFLTCNGELFTCLNLDNFKISETDEKVLEEAAIKVAKLILDSYRKSSSSFGDSVALKMLSNFSLKC